MTDYKAKAEQLAAALDSGRWDDYIAFFTEALEAAEERGHDLAEREWEKRDEASWDEGYKEGRVAGLREAGEIAERLDSQGTRTAIMEWAEEVERS